MTTASVCRRTTPRPLRWIRLAVDQGFAEAQFALGNMFLNGRGVAQDLVEAIRWVRLAADQGFIRAQFNLALSYDAGTGVPQDSAEAARWFRRAADQGDPGAQQNLGVMFANGDGVTRDLVAAHMWLSLAADRATGAGRDSALQGRDMVARQLRPDEVAESDRRAGAWRPVPES